jgi:hypothetical protein
MKAISVPAVLRSHSTEAKAIDIPATAAAFSTTAVFTLLNGMVPGTGSNNRVGRKISMKSLAIRGFVRYKQVGTAPSDDYLRIIVFYDRQPNGAAPAFGDVIQATDNGGGTTTDAIGPLNINNADRFKVLRDIYWSTPYALAAEGVALAAKQNIQDCTRANYKMFIKLNGLEEHFNAGVAGTIADITTGSIFMMTVSRTAAANAQYEQVFSTRMRYMDM